MRLLPAGFSPTRTKYSFAAARLSFRRLSQEVITRIPTVGPATCRWRTDCRTATPAQTCAIAGARARTTCNRPRASANGLQMLPQAPIQWLPPMADFAGRAATSAWAALRPMSGDIGSEASKFDDPEGIRGSMPLPLMYNTVRVGDSFVERRVAFVSRKNESKTEIAAPRVRVRVQRLALFGPPLAP